MGIPAIPEFVYSLMLWGGIIGLIAWTTFIYVPPPWNYVVEVNLPFCETIKLVYSSGLRFLKNPSYGPDKEQGIHGG